MNNIAETISNTLVNALNSIIAFIPSLIAGLIILLVGWIIAALLKTAVQKILQIIHIRRFMERMGIEKESTQDTWITVIAQVVFWGILIFFLIPAFEAWSIPQVNVVLNQLLLYLPSVIAAVVIGFLGFVFSNLLADIVMGAARGYGKGVAGILSGIARYAILIFTGLIVLDELGIAQTLIQIFMTGIMFALALAVGLAFGLGGRENAGKLLDRLFEGAQKRKK